MINKISIKNCKNIDSGVIDITDSKLNIKFGINGIGKSTIAKAIQNSVHNPTDLSKLRPFKLIESGQGEIIPEVTGTEGFKNILIFNEDYLNQFVFKQDELIQNSFDIFIKTSSYNEKVEKIESIISNIKNVFKNDQDLNKTIEDLQQLSDSFKSTQSGISKASMVAKSLESGNKIEHIPGGLESYGPFLKSDKCVDWIDWQINGNDFLDISPNCPYCVSLIEGKKDQIRQISKEYDKKTIKNLISIIRVIEALGKYFSNEARETLLKITTQKEGLEKAEMSYLFTVKTQIDGLLEKLKKLQGISSVDFKDVEKVIDILNPLKIDIGLFDRLKSNEMETIVKNLNNSLGIVLGEAGKLQGEVNKQKSEVKKIIEENEKEINQFLRNAGYKYKVLIDPTGEYKLRLQHFEFNKHLEGGTQYLSFGEKNAFALVLFMYESLFKNSDLIILDDPISSFDINKKYAIMEMLFKGNRCLKGKTVLMLTHDIEPVIDTIKVLKWTFGNLVKADFLKLNEGVLTEKEITCVDIITFSEICEKIISSNDTDEIIKLIYLRRYYEIIKDRGDEYQVLSNLFKKRTRQGAEDFRIKEENKTMDEKCFDNGVDNIKKKISGFDYDRILERISSLEEVRRLYNSSLNGYEKLQLFRILEIKHESNVLAKFINETYHIENEYICQLNPKDFDLIPSFIIEECDKLVKESSAI